MSDLGLVERAREGVRVTYTVTEEGEAFLSQYLHFEKA
jgi:predicted transcriptional regulator